MTKKQSIINSAIELFASQGIEATSVQQITSHAGISKGAFYLSFKSKDELVLAIIDYFMHNIVLKVDQAVRNTKNADELLFVYFETTFKALNNYSGLAEILIKEPLHMMSDDILEKIHLFDYLTDETIRYILDKCYSEEVEKIQYDFPFVVKGLFNAYSFLLFKNNEMIDFSRLSVSLAEKADILAKNMQQPYITKPIQFEIGQAKEITKELVLSEITLILDKHVDPIVVESLQILQEQFQQPQISLAIIKGMLANLALEDDCAWCSYLIKRYMENKKQKSG